MSLFILAYPQMAPADVDWIQGIRRRHDPNHAIVAPHFTLIFGVDGIDAATFAAHVAATVADVAPIAVTLRRVQVVRGDFDDDSYVYLVPDAGYDEIAGLHDRLHTGPLAEVARLPYTPHITVARFRDAGAATRLAADLGRRGVDVSGTIEALTIARLEDGAVTALRTIDLKLAS